MVLLRREHVNKGKSLLNPYFLNVLLSIPFNKLPCLKVLIGIAPCGLIQFISKAYGGRTTDSQITVDSGVLDKVENDDEWMMDKGFPEVSKFYIINHYAFSSCILRRLQNFAKSPPFFVLCTVSQIIGGDFAKFCGLLRIYEL